MSCNRCRHDRSLDTDFRHDRFDTGSDFFRPRMDTSDHMHDHHMHDHHMEHEHRRRRRRSAFFIGFPLSF